MTSVIGTPYARAPRNVRTKNPQLLLKNKEVLPGSNGVFQNSNPFIKSMVYGSQNNLNFLNLS